MSSLVSFLSCTPSSLGVLFPHCGSFCEVLLRPLLQGNRLRAPTPALPPLLNFNRVRFSAHMPFSFPLNNWDGTRLIPFHTSFFVCSLGQVDSRNRLGALSSHKWVAKCHKWIYCQTSMLTPPPPEARCLPDPNTSPSKRTEPHPCQACRGHCQHFRVKYLQTHGLTLRSRRHHVCSNFVSVRLSAKSVGCELMMCTRFVAVANTRLYFNVGKSSPSVKMPSYCSIGSKLFNFVAGMHDKLRLKFLLGRPREGYPQSRRQCGK